MIKITPEDLIRYLYHETSEQKTASIRAALQTDWNLKEAYENLLSARNNLNQLRESPRSETINKILEHASKRVVQVSSH